MGFSSIKRWATRIIPAAVLGLFIAGGALTAAASGPVFNSLPQDYATLQVTKAGGSWCTAANPAPCEQASASVGDTLYMLVWDHNDVPDTTAENVNAKVSIPSNAASNFTVTAKLSADNAATVTGNVAVATDQEAKLVYVPGSAQLLKNINNQMTNVNWPAGINGDDVVSANGVSLGNQGGCWQYAQAIMIQVKVEGTTPAINTNKAVAVQGGTVFSTAVTAQPNDVAGYRIFLQNTGSGTGIRPQIVDTLDAHTKYAPGTSYIRIKKNNNDVDQPIPDANIKIVTLADGRQQLTYQFTDMAPDPAASFYLVFEVKLAGTTGANSFPVGTTVVPNIATASFQNAGNVQTNQTTITVTVQQTPVVTFSVVKKVANFSNGDNTWKDILDGSAAPGDTVAYELILTNTGNTAATNVTLKDLLPAGITYVPGTAMLYNKNTTTSGVKIDDSIGGNGYVFSNVDFGNPNQQTIVFHAKLTNTCTGTQTLVNTAQAIWQNKVQAQDTATVIFACTRGLIIQKTLEVPGSTTWVKDGGVVPESSVIRYQIIVTNNGNTTVNNPVLRDTLPTDVTYDNNSLRIDGEVMDAADQNAFFNQGMLLTNFTPGMTKTITYDVKVSDCPTLGDHTLINTAFVKADSVAEISDSAKVELHVVVPTLTF